LGRWYVFFIGLLKKCANMPIIIYDLNFWYHLKLQSKQNSGYKGFTRLLGMNVLLNLPCPALPALPAPLPKFVARPAFQLHHRTHLGLRSSAGMNLEDNLLGVNQGQRTENALGSR
jgi:hypothetical protein